MSPGEELCTCDDASSLDPNDSCCLKAICKDAPSAPVECQLRLGSSAFPAVSPINVINRSGFGLPKACEPLEIHWFYRNIFSSTIPARSNIPFSLPAKLVISMDPNEPMDMPFEPIEFDADWPQLEPCETDIHKEVLEDGIKPPNKDLRGTFRFALNNVGPFQAPLVQVTVGFGSVCASP